MEPPSVSENAARSNEHTAIDLSAVTTDSGIDNLGFFDSAQYDAAPQTGYDVSGTLSPNVAGSGAHHYRKITQGGYAARFLENRGFGWLLEVDDETVDFQKPLLEELDIDLTDIYYKVRCVLLPLPYFRLKLTIVRDSPDFWGPLFVVSAYALLSLYGQLSVLSWIVTIWLIGSFFVFFLARALGGEVGYGQVLGIVGYCLIPLVVVGLFIPIVSSFKLGYRPPKLQIPTRPAVFYCVVRCPTLIDLGMRFLTLTVVGFRMLSIAVGCFGVLWSVYSAGTLLCVEELREKRTLLLYPVFLLYIYFFSLYSGV